MSKTTPVTIHIEEKMDEQIAKTAAAELLSKTDVYRECVRLGFKKRQSIRARMAALEANEN